MRDAKYDSADVAEQPGLLRDGMSGADEFEDVFLHVLGQLGQRCNAVAVAVLGVGGPFESPIRNGKTPRDRRPAPSLPRTPVPHYTHRAAATDGGGAGGGGIAIPAARPSGAVLSSLRQASTRSNLVVALHFAMPSKNSSKAIRFLRSRTLRSASIGQKKLQGNWRPPPRRHPSSRHARSAGRGCCRSASIA